MPSPPPARVVTLSALLALAPTALGAEEIVLGVQGRASYEERETSTETLGLDGVSFRGGPRIEALDREGDFTWQLEYQPSYEYFTQETSLSGWDHDLYASGDWRINPTTTISASDRFSRYRNEARFNETQIEEDGSFIVERADVRRFIRNTAGVELRHQFAPHQQIALAAGHTFFDYSDPEQIDRSNMSLTAQYLYTLSVRNTLGLSASWRRQTFEELGEIPERNTDFYNASLVWVHRFDPTFVLNVSAGPTWVESDSVREVPRTVTSVRFPRVGDGFFDASTCPVEDGRRILGPGCQPLDPRTDGVGGTLAPSVVVVLPEPELVTVGLLEDPPSSANERLTYFADISLIKTWEQWEGILSYQRRDDTTSGLGFSTIADIGTAALTYRPSERWRFNLRGSYVRQTQSQEGFRLDPAVQGTTLELQTFQLTGNPMLPVIPGLGVTLNDVAELIGVVPTDLDSDLEINSWAASFQARYRLTKRLTLIGDVFYINESQEGDLRIRRDFERYRVSLGFVYEFEPIRL